MGKFELVEIVTKDKLVHQGIFYMPQKAGKKALLWIHGLTGKFYGDPRLMNLFAKHCDKHGMGFAAFNNRGHDIISNFRKADGSRVMIGASSEKFEESVLDIDAAITFLADRGFSEIIIAGHSTGANKVCFYAANKNDSRVAGVVLAGPMSDRLGTNTDLWFPATELRKQSLLSPNSVEDVFNYGDSQNVLSVFNAITQPLLVVFSGNDEAADRPIETIKRVFDTHTASKKYTSVIIPDTTHSYEGKEAEFVNTVVSWGASL